MGVDLRSVLLYIIKIKKRKMNGYVDNFVNFAAGIAVFPANRGS